MPGLLSSHGRPRGDRQFGRIHAEQPVSSHQERGSFLNVTYIT